MSEWETIVDTDEHGKPTFINVEIAARIPFAIEDAAWSLPRTTVRAMTESNYYDPDRPGQKVSAKYPNQGLTIAPQFYGEIVITRHAFRPYVRMGTEGFFKRLDGDGPLRIEMINRRSKG